MPTYPNLPTVDYTEPEEFWRPIREFVGIASVLDVGAGHGGVFDYGALTEDQRITKREACDLTWIRDMDPRWTTRIGVDVQKLDEFYAPESYDLVQCMEVLEHVHDRARALEQLVRVAKKLVIITSADEMHHQGPEQEAIEKLNPGQRYIAQPRVEDLRDLGFQVYVDHHSRRQLIAWRVL